MRLKSQRNHVFVRPEHMWPLTVAAGSPPPAPASPACRCDAPCRVFAKSEADMANAFTLNYVEEAVGIAHAAKDAGIPVAISFTLATDRCLPTGQQLKDATLQVDSAPELDMSDPVELGQQYRELRRNLPQLAVLCGCCGTYHRHVEQIAFAYFAA